MHRRWLPSLLLLCAPLVLLAQNAPDFSGVYLRNPAKSYARPGKSGLDQRVRLFQEFDQALDEGSPLILVVTQTANSIEVTKIQNGAKVTSHYDLKVSRSRKDPPGGSKSSGRARFNKGTLLIEYNAPLPFLTATFRVEEKWQLSPDSRALAVQSLPSSKPQTYTRQPSLELALARANEASLLNKCVCLRFPGDDWSNSQGVLKLGRTAWQQLDTCVSFDADLMAEFFSGLERSETPKGSTFRKSDQLVSGFPDHVVLRITTKAWDCATEGPWATVMPGLAWSLPPELLGLRFRVNWVGSAVRELGELQPEFFSEPSSDLRPPDKFYSLDVPSDGVPLTDSLEVRILTKTGNQIGCIKGHI
jgi:hypothetical protein